MGRKPKSAKPEEKATPNENSNPTLERMEVEQRSLNNLRSKKKPSKGASSNMNAGTRRSGRIRKLKSPVSNQEMIVEEIDLADSEKEEEPPVQQSNSDLHVQQLNADPHVQQLNSEPHVQQSNSESLVKQSNSETLVKQSNSEPLVQQLNSDPAQQFNTEPISNQQNFEDKLDFLVQSVKEFKSQIEALTEENHHLAKQLEFAKGQVKAFEQMKDIFGNLKDMVLMSNMTKATEALINLSSQAATAKFCLPGATNDGVPLAAGRHQTTSPPARKRYVRKKKQMEVEKS